MEKRPKIIGAKCENGRRGVTVRAGVEARSASELEKGADLIENVGRGAGIHVPAICEKLAFGPCVAGHAVDHLMKLPLNQLDFLPRALRIEEAVLHVDRDAVHVFDLHQHLVGRATQ